MECNTVDLISRVGEPHHITIYSDIHDAIEEVLPHMRRRAELQNSHFVCLGDLFNLLVPNDTKRYMPSTVRPSLRGKDDFIDAAVAEALDVYGKFPWIMMGTGNHCHEVLKRHYTNPMARFAHKLGIPFGGFSGFLRLRFKYSANHYSRWKIVFLYHHGGSSGPVTKGLPWAQRFCSGFDGWDIFTYAHNHQCHVHQETTLHLAEKHDNLIDRYKYIVNCGTFLKTYQQGESPSYGEVKGYKPVALAAPLIRLLPLRDGKVEISISVGDS